MTSILKCDSMKKRTVDDFSIGESITWKEHTGTIQFISEQYLTLCIRTYDKPQEIAEHSLHKQNFVCLLVFREEWHNIVRTTRLHQTNNEGTNFDTIQYMARSHDRISEKQP